MIENQKGISKVKYRNANDKDRGNNQLTYDNRKTCRCGSNHRKQNGDIDSNPTLVCHHHYVALLKSAAQRDVLGPTKAPEECYTKRVELGRIKTKRKRICFVKSKISFCYLR